MNYRIRASWTIDPVSKTKDFYYFAKRSDGAVTPICGSRRSAMELAERGDWLGRNMEDKEENVERIVR